MPMPYYHFCRGGELKLLPLLNCFQGPKFIAWVITSTCRRGCVWSERTREHVKTMEVALEPIDTLLQQALKRFDSVPRAENMNEWDMAAFDAKRLWKSSPKCELCSSPFTLTQREHHLPGVCEGYLPWLQPWTGLYLPHQEQGT